MMIRGAMTALEMLENEPPDDRGSTSETGGEGAPSGRARESRRVLVVEDDYLVGLTICDLLSGCGTRSSGHSIAVRQRALGPDDQEQGARSLAPGMGREALLRRAIARSGGGCAGLKARRLACGGARRRSLRLFNGTQLRDVRHTSMMASGPRDVLEGAVR
jgi:hypothetical protein